MESIQTNIENIFEEIKSCDLWITCASFEDRWFKAINNNIRNIPNDGLYIFYVNEYKDHSANTRELLHNSLNSKEFILSTSNPIISANSIKISLEMAIEQQKKNIVIDISTFTRETLLILLKLVNDYDINFDEITFIYTTAEVSENLSEGIIETRSVIGYSGDISISKPLHLVIMSGFEINRAKYIIENYEPDYISIGFGGREHSINRELQKKNEDLSQKLKAAYPANQIFDFCFSLTNPLDTRNAIIYHLSEHKDLNANIVIAPLNNKISTIGAGLIGIENESIQLCYALPSQYNTENYSVCRDNVYVIKYK